MMEGLRSELVLQSIGAVQGSVPPEKFRQWLMSLMLEFESSGDEELIDLAFSFELLGFEFQRGDRNETEFIEALREAASETWLAPFLDIDLERTFIRLENPLTEVRSAPHRLDNVGDAVRAIIYADTMVLDSARKIGIMSFPTHL